MEEDASDGVDGNNEGGEDATDGEIKKNITINLHSVRRRCLSC